MKIKTYLLGITLGASSLLTAVPTFAADNNTPYIGFNGGTADDDFFDEQDTGFKLSIGYKASENLSYELAYVDLGSYFFDLVSQSGVAGNLIGSIPLTDNFSVFAKAGLFSWEIEAVGLSNTGSDLTYGFGLQYDMSDNVSFIVESEFYEVDGGDLTFASAGLKVSF